MDVEALLVDESLADQVWAAGVITDGLAAWAWSMVVASGQDRRKPERLEIIMVRKIALFWNKKKLTEAESRLDQLKQAVAEQEATIAQLHNQKEEWTRENATRTDDSFE